MIASWQALQWKVAGSLQLRSGGTIASELQAVCFLPSPLPHFHSLRELYHHACWWRWKDGSERWGGTTPHRAYVTNCICHWVPSSTIVYSCTSEHHCVQSPSSRLTSLARASLLGGATPMHTVQWAARPIDHRRRRRVIVYCHNTELLSQYRVIVIVTLSCARHTCHRYHVLDSSALRHY